MKKILYPLILSLVSFYGYSQVQLYGLTSYGGSDNLGTIFHYNPATAVTTRDQSFIYTTPGAAPQYADLTKGGNNKFYGMTTYGGTDQSDKGIIFEWDPATNIYTKKIKFNGIDGANPYGSLTLTNGKFYGSTSYGGSNNKGVIFEWDPSTNIYTKKIDFDGANGEIGGNPNGNLIYNNGKFYGTTPGGGLNDMGVIFEWDPVTNVYIKKIDFILSTGGVPFGSLTFKGGKFYGTTTRGGIADHGGIFEWDPATNTYTKKIDLDITNGSNIYGSLTENEGKFYGMTSGVGTGRFGEIFEWDPATNVYTKKIDFVGANGGGGTGSLLLNAGKFYGMTTAGGASNKGVIFEWDPTTNIYIKQRDFGGLSGESPSGSLVMMKGIFYGMTSYNGANNNGVIFEWDLATNVYTKKIDFNGTNGSQPYASLAKSGNKLYGTTAGGGANNDGTIFEFDPASKAITTKIDFKYIQLGGSPSSSLTFKNGKFFGTAGGGAYANTYSAGVIFEWDPATNVYTKKIDLNTTTGWGGGDNAMVYFAGKFYGTSNLGGTGTRGVIYEWDPVTNIYLIKFSFDGGADGGLPVGSLVLYNQKFYAMTAQGGTSGGGVIFEWDPVTNVYTKKSDFNQAFSSGTGYGQLGSLTFSNGSFYGMTRMGGAFQYGVLFEWNPATNAYTNKMDFDGTNGREPFGSLTLSGGKLYGMTHGGGTNEEGVMFEWNPSTNVYTKLIDFNDSIGTMPHGNLVEFIPGTLPVKLLSFTGSLLNKNAKLQWQIATAEEGSKYELERSNSGINFTTINQQTGYQLVTTFSYTDNALSNGTYYYRLKIKDKDGKTTYSPIIKITLAGKTELQIFPNPAKDIITLSGLQNKGIIKIISPEGQLVKQLNPNANSMMIDISTLAKGMYIVQYNIGETTSELKIIKE